MNVVCVGDSITFGQYLPPGVPAWPERVGAVGRGVCGETTRQALERFPRDVQNNPADVTILQYGHNDANQWESDRGLPRVSLGAFEANLREMLRRCRVFHTISMLCTITPVREDDYEKPYDEAIRYVAEEGNVRLIDVRAAFELAGTDALLLDDGLHPSEAGHELYAEVVKAVLSSYEERRHIPVVEPRKRAEATA